jgi:hypothetical protein
MNMMRAALLATLAVLLANGAWAQGPGGGPVGEVAGLGAQSYGVGPRTGAQHPTPLALLGGVAVGIWTRVPPPYDVTANRNAAANPLP